MKDLTTLLTHLRKKLHNVKNVRLSRMLFSMERHISCQGKKGNWSTENIDRKTDEEVEKLYNIYMQQQVQVKGEMTARAMGTHMVNLYSAGISKVLKIDDKEQLRRDI